MRALLDANLIVSYLLAPTSASAPIEVITRGILGEFVALVSVTTLDEVSRSISSKPYLVARIPQDRFDRFVAIIRASGKILPPMENHPITQTTRDPKDDYLIAHALRDQVDILVSGDRDLLALADVTPFRILTPVDFLAHLDER